jgi:PadR family transcriptional regulator PadR
MHLNKNTVLPRALNLMILKTWRLSCPRTVMGLPGALNRSAPTAFSSIKGRCIPLFLHLEQMGWISSKWAFRRTNQRAKYYSITRAGRKQLAAKEYK